MLIDIFLYPLVLQTWIFGTGGIIDYFSNKYNWDLQVLRAALKELPFPSSLFLYLYPDPSLTKSNQELKVITFTVKSESRSTFGSKIYIIISSVIAFAGLFTYIKWFLTAQTVVEAVWIGTLIVLSFVTLIHPVRCYQKLQSFVASQIQ